MKQYSVARVDSAPVWEDIDVAEINIPYLETGDDIKAFGQLAFDDERIYVHLYAIESDILANHTGPLGSPCEDSCLEFFFCPIEDDTRYFNIEFNTNKCVYLGIGSNVDNLVRLIPEKDVLETLSPEVEYTEGGWEITYSIPYEFVRQFFPNFTTPAGKSLRANFYKCADLTNPPHYLSWNEIVGEPFTFHKQHCFGQIKFSK